VALITNGSLSLGRVARIELRLHWTALIGALVFNGFRFDLLRIATFTGLLLLHEIGHALVVRACGATPLVIELTGFGGSCTWSGEVSKTGRAAIAWGGVWAQLAVLVAALLFQYFAPPVALPAREVLMTLTFSNAWLIVINLIPIEPLDGKQAWPLPLLLGRALRQRLSVSPPLDELAAQTQVLEKRDLAFDAGTENEEVKSLVKTLLKDAQKDLP
jgi:Zn-dependent protease